MLFPVIRKSYEIVPTVKIRLAAETLFALPYIARFTPEILFDEYIYVGDIHAIIVNQSVGNITFLFFVGGYATFNGFVV